MKIKYFLQLIILFFGIFWNLPTSSAANITETEATQWAQNKGNEILQILASRDIFTKYDKLDAIMYNDIDLEHAGKFVVGKYWRTMTDEQKEKYISIFKRYINSLYKSYPLDIDEGEISFSVDKVIADKNKINVFCTVFIKKIEEAVDEQSKGGIQAIFILTKKDDRIQVQDLRISESSLLFSFRDRFYKMIHNDSDDDIDWFLEELETITQDQEKENQEKIIATIKKSNETPQNLDEPLF